MRIIVLQADLQFDGFCEIAFLFLCGEFEEVFDILSDVGDRDFTTKSISTILTDGDGRDYLMVIGGERRRGGVVQLNGDDFDFLTSQNLPVTNPNVETGYFGRDCLFCHSSPKTRQEKGRCI